MAGRPNPFDEIQEMFDRLNRQFESATRAWEGESSGQLALSGGESTTGLDIADTGEEFVVTVDVPGYEKDDVTVRLTGDRLHMKGERKESIDADEESYVRRERTAQSFTRQVQLPEPVDADGVSATVNNGVLTITLPKVEPSDDSRSIEIE